MGTALTAGVVTAVIIGFIVVALLICLCVKKQTYSGRFVSPSSQRPNVTVVYAGSNAPSRGWNCHHGYSEIRPYPGSASSFPKPPPYKPREPPPPYISINNNTTNVSSSGQTSSATNGSSSGQTCSATNGSSSGQNNSATNGSSSGQNNSATNGSSSGQNNSATNGSNSGQTSSATNVSSSGQTSSATNGSTSGQTSSATNGSTSNNSNSNQDSSGDNNNGSENINNNHTHHAGIGHGKLVTVVLAPGIHSPPRIPPVESELPPAYTAIANTSSCPPMSTAASTPSDLATLGQRLPSAGQRTPMRGQRISIPGQRTAGQKTPTAGQILPTRQRPLTAVSQERNVSATAPGRIPRHGSVLTEYRRRSAARTSTVRSTRKPESETGRRTEPRRGSSPAQSLRGRLVTAQSQPGAVDTPASQAQPDAVVSQMNTIASVES